MANELAAGVWILNTANTSTVVDDRMLKVKSVRWDDASTADHKAVIKNKRGDIVWQSTAAGADNEDVELIEEWWDGLIMHTLQSGTIILRLS